MPSRPAAVATKRTDLRARAAPQGDERPLSLEDLTTALAPIVIELGALRGEVTSLAAGQEALRGEVTRQVTAVRKELSTTTRSVSALVEGFARFAAHKEPSYRGVLASSLEDLVSGVVHASGLQPEVVVLELCALVSPQAAPLLLRVLSHLRASIAAARVAAGEAESLSDKAGMLERELRTSPSDWKKLALLAQLVSGLFRTSSFAGTSKAGAAAALSAFASATAHAADASDEETARRLAAMDGKHAGRGASAAFVLLCTHVVEKPLLSIDFDGIEEARFSPATRVLTQPLMEVKKSQYKCALPTPGPLALAHHLLSCWSRSSGRGGSALLACAPRLRRLARGGGLRPQPAGPAAQGGGGGTGGAPWPAAVTSDGRPRTPLRARSAGGWWNGPPEHCFQESVICWGQFA